MSGQHQRLKGSIEKEQLEEFHHQPLSTQQLTIKRPERSQQKNYTLLILLAFMFLIIVFIVNYYFFLQMKQTISKNSLKDNSSKQSQNAVTYSQDLKVKLKAIEDSEAKIMDRISEINTKIDELSDQSLNIVAPNTVTNQPLQIQQSITTLSKQVNQLKNQISQVNKNIQKESVQSMNQMNQLMTLINDKNTLKEKENKAKSLEQDERSFEADFVIESDLKEEKFNSKSEVYVEETHIFDAPKKLWIFKENIRNYLHQLCFNNNINFGKDSKYEFVLVQKSNYKNYLPKKTADTVEKILLFLQKRAKSDPSNLKYHMESIAKKIILLNILNENGGLITTGEFAMTEDLSWLNKIASNQYVNRGNRGIKPQVVGFYSSDYSFAKEKQNIKPFKGIQQVDKFVTIFPALEDYFISAYKNTQFITKLIKAIYKLLKNPAHFKPQRGHYKLNNLKGEDIYYEYFLIAVQVVLQDKQKEIDSIRIDSYRHFAIDYYGLNLINCFYAPYKLKVFWGDGQSSKAFESLTQYTQEELFANIGPMRYIAKITPTGQMNEYLDATKSGKRKFIMEGSFIHKIFYSHSKLNFIRINTQKPFTKVTNALWTSLPKVIWVFWDKGLANAGVNNQICVQNLKRMGALSGFKVNQVNLTNIKQYIDENTLTKIQSAITNAKLRTYPQSKSDLFRLALLEKHGGIYMDASYIALQNFDWLINIGKYPSQYLFNRYGQLPKVFMMWHPHYGAPLEWKINEKYNIKSQWHLAYENNLIVAEKGSELVKEWFELLLQLYVKPYSEVEQIFQDCMMYSNKWSTSNWHYLIPMDTIKCVIGRRQVAISKDTTKKWESASEYYGIWSMSGYLGQQKFRSNTNFQNPGSQDHLFVYRYPQQYVQGLIGKIRHLVKYYSQHNRQLTIFVSRHMDGNFTSQAHSQSIFMKYMWSNKFKLQEFNFYPRLKVIA